MDVDIDMQDSFGDGWDEIFKIKQGSQVVAKFGKNTFKDGSSKSVSVTLPTGLNLKVVLTEVGDFSDQDSFTITLPDGTIIYELFEGQELTKGLITNLCIDCDGVSSQLTANDNTSNENGSTDKNTEESLLVAVIVMVSVALLLLVAMFVFTLKNNQKNYNYPSLQSDHGI